MVGSMVDSMVDSMDIAGIRPSMDTHRKGMGSRKATPLREAMLRPDTLPLATLLLGTQPRSMVLMAALMALAELVLAVLWLELQHWQVPMVFTKLDPVHMVANTDPMVVYSRV